VLQIVLYELAGDLTSDGLSIETSKGQLATALADLTAAWSSASSWRRELGLGVARALAGARTTG